MSSRRELDTTFGGDLVRDLDIRCSARLSEPDSQFARCQLAAGHEGEHAVMFSCGRDRWVRCWDHRSPGRASDHGVLDAQRAWLRGYPVPAWIEETSDRSAVW